MSTEIEWMPESIRSDEAKQAEFQEKLEKELQIQQYRTEYRAREAAYEAEQLAEYEAAKIEVIGRIHKYKNDLNASSEFYATVLACSYYDDIIKHFDAVIKGDCTGEQRFVAHFELQRAKFAARYVDELCREIRRK